MHGARFYLTNWTVQYILPAIYKNTNNMRIQYRLKRFIQVKNNTPAHFDSSEQNTIVSLGKTKSTEAS